MSNYNGERIETMRGYIAEAAEIIGGSGADPLVVFPDPKDKERRADIEWGDNLSVEQREELRIVMANLGPGRETNYGPEEAGLKSFGYAALLEGGQPHKMKGQLNLVTGRLASHPTQIVMSGSTSRILSDDEKSIGERIIGALPEGDITEAAMAESIVSAYSGRTVHRGLASSDSYHPFVERRLLDDVGAYKFENIGAIALTGVSLLGIHRVPIGGEGKFSQLTNAEKMILVADKLGSKAVAFVTSSTYVPSNEVQAYMAAKEAGIEVRVLSYGTEELARVKNEAPGKPNIAQLGAEAYKTAALLAKLA